MFSWQMREFVWHSIEAIRLKQEMDKTKKSLVVKPYEIPEHLKNKTNEG